MFDRWLSYSPGFTLDQGERVKDVVTPGCYVYLNRRWQKVKDMLITKDGGTLVTVTGEILKLDRSPPEDFRFKEPSTVPVALLAVLGVVLALIGVVLALIAAVTGVISVLH